MVWGGTDERAADVTAISRPTATTRSRPATHRPPPVRWALVFSVLGALYLLTATWSPPYNVDSFTNMIQARAFADGEVIVDEYEPFTDRQYRGMLSWMVPSPDGPTSQYPPGVALWGAPFYLLDRSVAEVTTEVGPDGATEEVTIAVPAFAPAALAAVAATTLAFVFLAGALRPHLDDRIVVSVVAVGALGTGAWSVASDQLWQHSPGMMAIALGMFAASRERFAASGLAFAFAALIRPHTVLIAAGIGLAMAIRRRSIRPALVMGATSALGLVALLAYNHVVWDEASITGGYSDTFANRLRSPSILVVGEHIVEFLFHPSHGVLISSSFLVVALAAVVTGRARGVPDWALGAALGAVAYTLVQLQANRVSGGNAIFGYRYPLEPLMAAAPLLAFATVAMVSSMGRRGRALFGALVAASILAHGYGALFVTA